MEPSNVLAQHPELAQMWTLRYAGRVALRVLDESHPRVVGDPVVRGAISEVKEAIDALVVALDHYKATVETRPAGRMVVLPYTWSPQQAHAVLDFVQRVADTVYTATEPELHVIE